MGRSGEKKMILSLSDGIEENGEWYRCCFPAEGVGRARRENLGKVGAPDGGWSADMEVSGPRVMRTWRWKPHRPCPPGNLPPGPVPLQRKMPRASRGSERNEGVRGPLSAQVSHGGIGAPNVTEMGEAVSADDVECFGSLRLIRE